MRLKPYVDGETLLREWEHLEHTERVLGRIFAHPITAGERDIATRRTPAEVPWELANTVD